MAKIRVCKDFSKLDQETLQLIRLQYPHGFEKKLINFVNSKGQKCKALPFETETTSFLIKATLKQARFLNNEALDINQNEVFEIDDDKIESIPEIDEIKMKKNDLDPVSELA